VSAITGYLTDPSEYLKDEIKVALPEKFDVNDNLIVPPPQDGSNVEVVRGPNIAPFPVNVPLPEKVSGKVLIKLGDNITTDHIMPSNAYLLPYRSNIPYLSNYCLTPCDENFPKKAKENGGGFILGGSNYGQGSSREHAALVPLYLGIKGVLAKSFARIHMANLINSGILPLTFINEQDYDKIDVDDELLIDEAKSQVDKGEVIIKNLTKGEEYKLALPLTQRQKEIIKEGGLLNYTRRQKA